MSYGYRMLYVWLQDATYIMVKGHAMSNYHSLHSIFYYGHIYKPY